MNWLAHLYLSAPNAEFRVGNLLPDLVAPLVMEELTGEMRRGAICHRRIDAFTDGHPVVRQSIARLPRSHQRFGGIIVDVLYDHFLCAAWETYSSEPLSRFIAGVHDSFDDVRPVISITAWAHLARIREERLLNSYKTLGGIREALRRTGGRLRNPVDLGAIVENAPLTELHADFSVFFPELRQHIAPLLTPNEATT